MGTNHHWNYLGALLKNTTTIIGYHWVPIICAEYTMIYPYHGGFTWKYPWENHGKITYRWRFLGKSSNYPLVICDITMEHGPFLDDVPTRNGDVYQMGKGNHPQMPEAFSEIF